jgi:hypothetical protein
MIQELINKFAPMLEKHGVKLSAAEETVTIEMAVEGALADGTAIFSPASEWVEGVEIYVMDAEGNPIPLADGEYSLDNGKIIVVSEGKVASIAEAPVNEEENPVEEEQAAEESYSKDQVEAMLNNIINEFTTKLSAVEAQLSEANSKIVELSKAPAINSVKQRATQTQVVAPVNLKEMKSIHHRANAIVAKYTNK